MNFYLINCFLIFLSYSSIITASDWSTFALNDLYPVHDTSNCVFPYTYNGVQYNDCINIDNDYGIPWCSITKDYMGLYTYCYDFRQPKAKCLDFYQTKKKNFTGCDFLTTTSLYKQCYTDNPDMKKMYCIDLYTQKSGKPLVHPDTCEDKYKSLSPYHSKCIGPSDYAIPVPISEADKTAILAKHNEYRGAVNAKSMFKLYWDDELADMAQAHSNLCAFDHDLATNRLSTVYKWRNGQNMMQANYVDGALADLVDMMLGSEKPNFRYGDKCSNGDGSCLHYTQAMISTMTRVGCADTHCLYPDRVERIFACNYIQSQYSDTYSKPYVPSDVAASDCPAKKVGTLCDCGNKICNFDGGETINPNTCECQKSSKRSIDQEEFNDENIIQSQPFHIAANRIESLDEQPKVHVAPENDLIKRNIRQILKKK